MLLEEFYLGHGEIGIYAAMMVDQKPSTMCFSSFG
jgi:hypothetical protein